MRGSVTRRALIEHAAAAATAAVLPLRVARTQPTLEADAALEVAALGDGLAVIRGAGAHITVADTGAGLVLVDSGLPGRVDAVSAALAAHWPGRAVRTVFNTNWGSEHTGGNAPLIAGGAEVLAHENTRLWMGAEFDVEWSGETHGRCPRSGWPTSTFYEGGMRTLGDVTLRYGHVPRAHTDGDIYVHLVDHDVLAVSDLLAVDSYPVLDYVTGGWIGGMLDATRMLLDVAGPTTRIVTATGPVQTRAALERQLALCETVYKAVGDCYRSGGSLEEFIASRPTAEFEAVRGDPEQFLALVYEGAWGHIRSLGRVI